MTEFLYQLTPAQREVYRRSAGLALPRHTSYPIATEWGRDYGPADYLASLQALGQSNRPVSLYVHVPFCERLCYYCACTKEIIPAKKRAAADPSATLLSGLEIEARRLGRLIGGNVVRQIHLGGGTPTFLPPDALLRLTQVLRDQFAVAGDAEIAVEIDPRVTTRDHLAALRTAGFNRVSIGVQDFAERVQQAVNRVQPFEMVAETVRTCRELGYTSVNFDLIYGLPYQTLESMADTLDRVIELSPDRVAFYRLAVIPDMFRWQNTFRHADLPGGERCLDLFLLVINRFLAEGYQFIGLDHFAKPSEALAQAAREGTLRRNFQGMATGKDLEVVALGPSGISQLDDAFAQNAKSSADWREAIDAGFATECGRRLTADDRVRRELMQQLYGYGAIDKRALEAQFGIEFDSYFADELVRLRDLEREGIVADEGDAIRLTTPLGRLLVRVAAAVFDRYLPADTYRVGMPTFSKVG